MISQDFHAPDPAKTRPEVLIVEDERTSRRALAMLLAASGYPTEAVGSAEEALKVVRKGHLPHVALVDLNLPGMNGLDLIRQLEQLDPDVFPVLITAASEEMLSQALQQHGVVYLRKPLDFSRLLSLLSEQELKH